MNPTAQDEITAYVEGVRAALAGLPAAARDELLDDLPEHLAEVRAEGTGTLTERLGTPEAYASELRATAGFGGGHADPAPGRFATLQPVRDQLARRLRRVDGRVGPLIGYATASEFLVLLRPAWWVLRGYLAAMAVAYLLDDSSGRIGLLPRLGGSNLVALVLLAGCVLVSILLGRRGRLSTWPRYALWSGTAVLVLFAISGFLTADRSTRGGGYSDVSSVYVGGPPFPDVQDVFVYDAQGRLVQGARLFDQDGRPIQLGPGLPADCIDPGTGVSRPSRSLGYPYCPENAPFTVSSAGPPGVVPPAAGPPDARPSAAGPSAPAGEPTAGPSAAAGEPTAGPASSATASPASVPGASPGPVTGGRPSVLPSVARSGGNTVR